MITVTFEIPTSYVDHFVKYREIRGGCVIPVKRLDSSELGAMLICHMGAINHWESQLDKIKWIVSCYCPYDHKSPFGGNKNNSVHTKFNKGSRILEVSYDPETDEQTNPVDPLANFHLSSRPLNLHDNTAANELFSLIINQ